MAHYGVYISHPLQNSLVPNLQLSLSGMSFTMILSRVDNTCIGSSRCIRSLVCISIQPTRSTYLRLALGPIVRINPYELSVNDTDLDFMNRLYPVGKEVDKFWWSAGMFGNTDMTFGTIPHHLHKLRRAAFAKFFSPTYIRRLEPLLKDLVNLMIEKITEGIEAGKEVNLVHAFSALTQDIITEYCFSSSRNVLQKEDFAPHWYDWMQIHCAFSPM